MGTMNHQCGPKRMLTRVVESGAQDEAIKVMDYPEIVWRVGDDEISNTCVHLEELVASAAHSGRGALSLIARINKEIGQRDVDLQTALTKYVTDTCKAIKDIDNVLRCRGSGLAQLLDMAEPNPGELSWRDLVALRDVLAFRLLAIDDEEVTRKAAQDFEDLCGLLTQIHFVPIKLDLDKKERFNALFKVRCIVRNSSAHESWPAVRDLVFVCEDRKSGFLSFAFKRT